MAAGIGSMNVYYQRHDENNNPIANPASTADNSDPGEGWSNLNYLDFNADYVRYSDTPGITTTPPAPYVRRDENNVIVPNPPPIPNS